jgi:hypothetical protein
MAPQWWSVHLFEKPSKSRSNLTLGKLLLAKADDAAAAAFKRGKYAVVAATQQAAIIPFSVESTDGIGNEAETLITQLCVASRDFLCLPSHHPLAHDVSSIAICLLLCFRLVGVIKVNTHKTLYWSAVCAASVSGREMRV